MVGFSEDHEHVGIAVARTERLTVSQQGMDIELSASESDGSRLTKAIAGVVEVLNPGTLRTELYLGAWSYAIDGDYEASCATLAKRTTGNVDFGGAEAHDTAVMVDIRAPIGFGQVEYGVVSALELQTRLEDPVGHGQIARAQRVTRPASPPLNVPDLDPVSLFFDVHWLPAAAPPDRPVNPVAELSETEGQVRRLVEALGEGV